MNHIACPDCRGTGMARQPGSAAWIMMDRPCRRCGGRGLVEPEPFLLRLSGTIFAWSVGGALPWGGFGALFGLLIFRAPNATALMDVAMDFSEDVCLVGMIWSFSAMLVLALLRRTLPATLELRNIHWMLMTLLGIIAAVILSIDLLPHMERAAGVELRGVVLRAVVCGIGAMISAVSSLVLIAGMLRWQRPD